MKKTICTIAAVTILLSGCTARRGAYGESAMSEELPIEPLTLQTEEGVPVNEVGFRAGEDYLYVDLPEDWAYSRVDSNYGDQPNVPEGCCGLTLYRIGGGGGTMTLLHYPYRFGVCGTGLEEKTMTRRDGCTANIGYYDGNLNWFFVAFRDSSDYYAAENHGLSGADAEAALEILSTAVLTDFEPKTRFDSVSSMLEYWETFDCEPEWVSSISSTSGGEAMTLLLLEGYEGRADEVRTMLPVGAALTVETGGKYSDLELKRINAEIADNYMPPADGVPVIASCGVGWHTVDGRAVGFGESGRENRVVVDVLREHAEKYRALFEAMYGDRVVVEETDGFVTFD